MRKKYLMTTITCAVVLLCLLSIYHGMHQHRFKKNVLNMVERKIQEKHPDAQIKTVEYLRKKATVTGVSDPKYYLWISAHLTKNKHYHAAMRIAAASNEQIEILHTIDCEMFSKNPDYAKKIFPVDVAELLHIKSNTHC